MVFLNRIHSTIHEHFHKAKHHFNTIGNSVQKHWDTVGGVVKKGADFIQTNASKFASFLGDYKGIHSSIGDGIDFLNTVANTAGSISNGVDNVNNVKDKLQKAYNEPKAPTVQNVRRSAY